MWIRSLDQEDPLEKEMVIHSSFFCLEKSMEGGAFWATGGKISIFRASNFDCCFVVQGTKAKLFQV